MATCSTLHPRDGSPLEGGRAGDHGAAASEAAGEPQALRQWGPAGVSEMRRGFRWLEWLWEWLNVEHANQIALSGNTHTQQAYAIDA